MIVRRTVLLLAWALLCGVTFGQGAASAQKYVVFKVKTPFQMGGAVSDSAKLNDYYVKIGSLEGIQIGAVMNVYREKEIEAEFGNFTIKIMMFIGRMKAYDVQEKYTIGRLVELATTSDPHRERNAVMLGDFVQPVFVVTSETLFDQGSDVLRPEAIRQLERAAAFIRKFRPQKVRIEGHTDNVGEEDINLSLSERRADSVRRYLVSQGKFKENLFITVGYGESKPLASNDTRGGQRKNRRFEIVIER